MLSDFPKEFWELLERLKQNNTTKQKCVLQPPSAHMSYNSHLAQSTSMKQLNTQAVQNQYVR